MSAIEIFGPPPPGTDLTEDRGTVNTAATIAVYVLAVIAVALRFYARVKAQKAEIAADDYVLLAGLVSESSLLAFTIWGGYHGLGKHIWAVPIPDIIMVSKIMFIYVLLYAFTVPLIKVSIILFYRRIFGMNWTLWVCLFLAVGYFVSVWIAFLVACQPPSYFWTQYADPTGGKCIFDLYPFYVGNAAANVVTDGIILLVPVPLVWKLQMRTAQKVMICGIFLLGGFVCIASIVRIHFMTYLRTSVDVTWIMGDVFVWSSVEPCIAIVCACLPTLQPLLRRAFKNLLSTKGQNAYNTSQTPGPGASKNSRMGLSGNESRKFQHLHSANDRMHDDETGLTTCTANVEMDSISKSDSNDGKREGSVDGAAGITVKKDFQWRVERQ